MIVGEAFGTNVCGGGVIIKYLPLKEILDEGIIRDAKSLNCNEGCLTM